jgi:hypothetical protein
VKEEGIKTMNKIKASTLGRASLICLAVGFVTLVIVPPLLVIGIEVNLGSKTDVEAVNGLLTISSVAMAIELFLWNTEKFTDAFNRNFLLLVEIQVLLFALLGAVYYVIFAKYGNATIGLMTFTEVNLSFDLLILLTIILGNFYWRADQP